MARPENLVLFPLSQDGYLAWKDRSKDDIRAALRAKAVGSSSRSSAVAESDIPNMKMGFSTRNTTESV